MNWTFLPKIRREIIFSLLILGAPVVFFFIGIPPAVIAKDAGQYNAFATHLSQGLGYTLDGNVFSNAREPGYPAFLALIYRIFGVENFFAVYIVQTVLLGVLGFVVYRIFKKREEENVGLVAGFATSLLPAYGMYAHNIDTELIFAFLLGGIFYVALLITNRRGITGWGMYFLFGLLCAVGTLTRLQLMFFLPFLILCYVLFLWPVSWLQVQKITLACAIFIFAIGSWVFYIHQKIGTYALTTGRPEVVLYLRAMRAQLSYAEITQYGIDWVRRSITGGVGTPFLTAYEYRKLGLDYSSLATSSASVAAVKKQNIATLIANPGHYVYGNLIEGVKMAYIEHDYSDYTNRYFRAALYVVIYSLFLFGLVELLRRNQYTGAKELKIISTLALLFIIYNYLVLTPFDTIPRYNTPYLVFYMVIGFVGIALWRLRRKTASGASVSHQSQ